MTITAIETLHRGYRMRSRTEARWAVCFDALGIKWEYEREGFHLPSGDYLPDFWIRGGFNRITKKDWGTILEVKGSTPTESELQLTVELCQATGWKVELVCGNVGSFDFWRVSPIDSKLTHHPFAEFWSDCFPHWPEEAARLAYAHVFLSPLGNSIQQSADGFDQVREAIAASRAARWEHGETP